MVTATVSSPAPAPQGHCSHCGRVWTLNERQGVCQWCGKLATCQSSRTKPHHIKSSRRRKRRQADRNGNGHNGYDHLDGQWLTYYRVASQFSHKAKAQDREDLLHDIILTLANVERNNGHKPFTEAAMYRIASRAVALYWRRHYRHTNGLTCGNCSKAQRQRCRRDWLYPECPKAIKLESLNKEVVDAEGNTTELGELIADDKALDLAEWLDINTFLLGCPDRLIAIAEKIRDGKALSNKEHQYLWRFRQKEQNHLF